MAKMNWDRVRRETPGPPPVARARVRVCDHEWHRVSNKWLKCVKCMKFNQVWDKAPVTSSR